MHTPIDFDVTDAVFDEQTACLVLGGLVPARARVAPGMKLSVAVHPSFALELAVARVAEVGSRCGRCGIAVWIEAGSAAEAALLKGLDVGDETLLLWEAGAAVDPARHFFLEDGYAEVTVALSDLR